MTASTLLAFVTVATVVVLIPGPDFAVVTKNTVAGGRRRGWATSAGVTASNSVQGVAAAVGLGGLVVRSQPLFQAIKWAGVAYLAYLAVQSFRSAWRGQYHDAQVRPQARAGFRQGFVSNITNPKVLVFYLAVLPQFMARSTSPWLLTLLALTHAVISLAYLSALVAFVDRALARMRRRRVRRVLDAVTGTALGAFSARLAVER